MKHRILSLLLSLLCLSCGGQSISEEKINTETQENLSRDTKVYTEALKNYNFEQWVEYSLPTFVDKMGGKEKYLQSLKNSPYPVNEMINISIDLKSNGIIIRSDNKRYCVLDQTAVQCFADDKENKFSAKSKVVGESTDGGKTWTFANLIKSEVIEFYPAEAEMINKYLIH